MNWSFFDKIYCINLYEREDRYNNSKKIFEDLNIPITYFRTDRLENGTEGCFNSHLYIINDAVKNNYNNILIFEDDIYPNDVIKKRLNNIIDFVSKNNFDIFYVGSAPIINESSSIVDKKKKIYKLKSLNTHAYILNKETMLRLKDLKFDGTPIDYYYMKNLKESFAIYPSLFYQGPYESSIEKGFNSKKKTQKPFDAYSKIKEGYSYYIGVPFYNFFFLLLLLTIICAILRLNVIIIIFILFCVCSFAVIYRQKK